MAILSLLSLSLYQTSLHYLLNVFQTEISSYPSQPPSTEQIVVTVLCHTFCETKYSQSSKHKLALSQRFESNLFKSPSTNRPKQTFVQFIFPKYFLKTQKYPQILLLMTTFSLFWGKYVTFCPTFFLVQSNILLLI